MSLKWTPATELPDSDITVLMRLDNEEYSVWPGFHDGEAWRNADASLVDVKVIGWMHLNKAARHLDEPTVQPNTWTTRALTGGGSLTIAQVMPGKTILRATMKWKGEKPVKGKVSLSVTGALQELEKSLTEDAAKEMQESGTV